MRVLASATEEYVIISKIIQHVQSLSEVLFIGHLDSTVRHECLGDLEVEFKDLSDRGFGFNVTSKNICNNRTVIITTGLFFHLREVFLRLSETKPMFQIGWNTSVFRSAIMVECINLFATKVTNFIVVCKL